MKFAQLTLFVTLASACWALSATREVQAGGCGCDVPSATCGGTPLSCGAPHHACYGPPIYIHSHCHPGCRHHAPLRRERDRGALRDAQPDYRSAAPIPVVSSMPVFSTPMMMASVPVMPAMATRAAAPEPRYRDDCHERLDRLEDNVKQLAEAMAELQGIVRDQTRALAEITKHVKPETP